MKNKGKNFRHKICKRMREAKARKFAEQEQCRDLEPGPLPELRRVVIVIDYDVAPTINIFRLFRSNRINSYRAEINGNRLHSRMGWANFCKRLSSYMPRVSAYE